ncbi:TetR/AcrR family transcriptional regulator [Streptomyces lunaelactis]|uniref:TetR/AcrR family transcriptional regulator n=1 Tax=Streptomyces lunaelactis TaxID=1535768 RepID=UPI00158579C0|nr:TetR/AcrR family transcriptional regulator [Streptomyces lunaelactis]NUK02671.1 TetR/AcrR family transcriptional regulator [Streptomyces lunaelactis]NUK07081.1 TetR/AcrR family transcriptional regulator [Streptomyces lunaelactis]NUK17218.1 TetR/AcrR family transcriptional regulator [Streptomyces lunaelactis]NUK24024.1 TetR/AcrR family transcriptional regulator [Streptomyces lunaelactis]NUK33395.1 TetR/AcrR family transcriptional regulator [Streptomyces lunaelactis]
MTHGVRVQQREHTRRALLRESRRLFSTLGYSAVGLSEIVRAAGVTKGALYHHFDSKAELFRAVLEEVQQEVAEQVAATADAHEVAWDQLTTGCQAFLSASTAPAIQRIMLVDGPAVLGWSEWRAMNEATSARHLAEALTVLISEGTIAPQPVAPLTHLLSGAMNEAALWLAASTNPADLADTRAALARMLEALRTT